MGCCASTQSGKPNPTSLHHLHGGSKSPPTAEEEAVKEVLSETPTRPDPNPNPNPNPLPDPNPYYYTPTPKFNSFPSAILAAANNPIRHRSTSPRKPLPLKPPAIDEASEVSEISCVSEAISTATEVESEIKKRAPRSPSPGRARANPNLNPGPYVFRRERMSGKSPVKRSEPQPRWSGSAPGHVVARNRVGEGSSTRRSRSPGTRNVGRSPSGRKAGISPGRIRVNGAGPGKLAEGEGDPNYETGPSESLENPLVSLECFIFL